MVVGRLAPTIRQLLSTNHTVPPVVEVNGWVKSIRRQKNVSFAMIDDGSSANGLQAVFSDTQLDLADCLSNGTSVKLTGQLRLSRGRGQQKELQVAKVEVLGRCDPATYPIQKQALTVDYLRDQCHLRARVDKIGAMLRIRDRLTREIHAYFEGQAFQYAHTPITTSNDCEGAGEAFSVAPVAPPSNAELSNTEDRPFFGQPAYLTVSSQLHLEALSHSLSRVYTLAPAFRAERSQTSRHLAEFWMLEAEWQFTRGIRDVCALVEDMTKSVVSGALTQVAHDFNFLWKDDASDGRHSLQDALERPWVHMSYTDAIRELEAQHITSGGFEFAPGWGRALQSEHERWLAETLVGGPVFVTDYPAALKPFYMRANADGRTVACFDLLVPRVGELVGGSLREERLMLLDDALATHGLDPEAFAWYRDLRRFGGAPHGGFGMGFERLVSWATGIDNVRECIAMPRWAGRMLL